VFQTLYDFLTHTKGVCYLLAFGLLIGFIPFFKFLTDREDRK